MEVEVETAYGPRVGKVMFTILSPYYSEAVLGVRRAFVVSLPGEPMWTDYILPADLKYTQACDCTGCDRALHETQMCPECGLCLADCCICPPVVSVDDLANDPEYAAFLDRADREFEERGNR